MSSLTASVVLLGLTCVPGAIAAGQRAEGERPTSTLVWQGTEVNAQAAVTPDGRFIAFAHGTTGDLVLRELASNSNRTVVAAPNATAQRRTAYAEGAAVSRDGALVAYSWFDATTGGYELWVARLHGEARPRRVFGPEMLAWLAPRDWSPDGQWIAALVANGDFTQHIALVSVGTGALKIIKTGRGLGDTRVFFSPDGRHVAYDLPQDVLSARDVWVTALDGSTDSRVVANRANDAVMGWTPDGAHLLFTTDLTRGTALFAVPMAGGTARGPAVALKPDMGSAQSLGVARSGALFSVTLPGRRAGTIQVGEFDLQSGAVTSRRDVSTSPMEDNVNPSWSPDGRYLAYVSQRGRQGEPPALVVRSASGGGLLRELQPRLRRPQLAGWGSDSRALLVTGEEATGRSGAFLVDLESGETAFLLATPPMATINLPTLSPDGQRLYYWNGINDGAEHVFIAHRLGAGVATELVRRPFLGAMVLSPDGRFIATETVDPNANERVLLLVATDGSGSRELLRIPSGVAPADLKRVETRGARLTAAAWAPGSGSIIARIHREPGGANELWDVPIDGGSPRRLPSMLEPGVFAFRISPDGRRVAYRVRDTEPAFPAQVWEFRGFLPVTTGRP